MAPQIQNSHADSTSDDVVLASLQQFQHVTSEKSVWVFWDTGLMNAKPWTQRNVICWVRRLNAWGWTIRVFDRVLGLFVNVSRYIEDASWFLVAFDEKSIAGTHTGPHSADIVRIPLLYIYGGIWMDIGSILFRDLDSICWDALSDSGTTFTFSSGEMLFQVINCGYILSWTISGQ